MKATTYRFSFSLSIHVLRQATYCFLTAVPGDVLLAPPDVHGLRDHGGRQCEHDSALFHVDLAVSIHSLTLHSLEVVITVNLSRNL